MKRKIVVAETLKPGVGKLYTLDPSVDDPLRMKKRKIVFATGGNQDVVVEVVVSMDGDTIYLSAMARRANAPAMLKLPSEN